MRIVKLLKEALKRRIAENLRQQQQIAELETEIARLRSLLTMEPVPDGTYICESIAVTLDSRWIFMRMNNIGLCAQQLPDGWQLMRLLSNSGPILPAQEDSHEANRP